MAGIVKRSAASGVVPDGAGLADLATLCHELRTPINAVLGYAELLLDGSAGPLGAEARQYCGHIQDAGRHLGELIEALLLLAELRRGDAPAALAPLDLVELLAGALADHAAPGSPVAVDPAGARLVLPGDARLLRALGRAIGRHHAAGGQAGPLRLQLATAPAGGRRLTVHGLPRGAGDGAILAALAGAVAGAHGGRAVMEAGGALTLVWPPATERPIGRGSNQERGDSEPPARIHA